jgi:hypothetical protein
MELIAASPEQASRCAGVDGVSLPHRQGSAGFPQHHQHFADRRVLLRRQPDRIEPVRGIRVPGDS